MEESVPALSAPLAAGLELSSTFLPSSRSPRDASLVEWGGGRWPRACRPSTLWGLSYAASRRLGPVGAGFPRVARRVRVDLGGEIPKMQEASDFSASVGVSALDFRVCKTAVVVPGALGVDWPACFGSVPCRGESLESVSLHPCSVALHAFCPFLVLVTD